MVGAATRWANTAARISSAASCSVNFGPASREGENSDHLPDGVHLAMMVSLQRSKVPARRRDVPRYFCAAARPRKLDRRQRVLDLVGDAPATSRQAALRWAFISRVMSSKVSTSPSSMRLARTRSRRVSRRATSTSVSASAPRPARRHGGDLRRHVGQFCPRALVGQAQQHLGLAVGRRDAAPRRG
jgi:hypothetical protein